MAAIIISIGHDDNFAIMDILDLEVRIETGPDGIDHSGDFFVSKQGLLIIDIGGILRLSP